MTQMSKGVTHRSTSAGVGRAQAVAQLTLKEIRQSIPTECFVKSPSRSLYYLCRDSSIFLALGGGMFMAMRSPEWATMHPAAAGALLMAYWMASGFIMWCMFVVGHDCGHGSFSSSWLLNTVCGHLMHAPLMVPYHAWAESHRRHHLYHNHYTRDYSFPWFTSEDLKAATASVAHKIRVTFPFTGFFMYLAGIPDGGHWLPFGGRLWEHATFRRYLRGLVSSVSVGLFLFTLGTATNWDTWFAFRLYGGCWLWFSFWLVTVTYLQHHDEETLVYTNDDWTFLRGAFQTIDREYGHGIDEFHHHITDGHLVHHLFFTQIPHYNLPKATKALREFLNSRGFGHLYRHREQRDFYLEVFRTLYRWSFFARRPTKDQAAATAQVFAPPRK